ncbi:AAA family ATPase [uncultured Faecalibaculum sp.]|uniref:AAA family ATPase n=2 Tax=uncultured Faecalibaculum sp. TaxID=1729681 RepID=UPI00260E3B1B|nr:AAA family ATPase [uncultured Faecalibaculum sp.]
MFLKRIELQGFKSFADKTVLQFDQGVTGIVGPNGCGKSNINDAIRWVLGEQSTKSLRSGSAMSDIIFSGSEVRKPVNLASVSLVFDNTSRVFATDFDEVEITRVIRRNKDAQYLINRTPCRLKDVTDLVMDTGLGRDSLSIITQGNISSFADARPEERRSLFEEAAGVAKYKKRKKTSLAKLEQTQANLDRLQDILDELERQLGPLEKQAEKARRYITLRDELAAIEITVLADEIGTLKDQVDALERDIEQSRQEENRLGGEITLQESRIESLRQETAALDVRILEVQKQYAASLQERVGLEKRKAQLDEQRRRLMESGSDEDRRQQLQALVQDARMEYEDRLDRLNGLEKQRHQKEADLLAVQKEQERWMQKTAGIRNRLQDLQRRQDTIQAMIRQPYAHQQGVNAVMKARQSLQGIEGTAAGLLHPCQGMGAAVNAALGGAVFNIITDDEASARQAIRFLKQNRSGRATFLPMSVCRPRYPGKDQETIAASAPGAVGWASDLVTCDARYESVRDRLLGNIFVCDTLEHANETARRLKYKIKIVTRDGDIVHTGGSMTGGSQKQGSSLLTLQDESRNLEQKIQEAESQADSCAGNLEPLRRQEQTLKEELVGLQVEAAKLENIAALKKEKYENLKSQLAAAGEEEDRQTASDSLTAELSAMHRRIDEQEADMNTLQQRRRETGETLSQAEAETRQLQQSLNRIRNESHKGEVAAAGLKSKLESRLMRLNTDYTMTYEYALTQKKDVDLNQARVRVGELRQALREIGAVNLDAPEEYDQLNARYTDLCRQKEDLETAGSQIRSAISEMDETMATQFEEMFHRIDSELDGVFSAMFGGGHARLILTDPEDLLNSGVDIDVQPPGKRVKNIQTFSGGEKALIAISVLFAILKARTMPLCIFDEVEAALDQANVERFARYLSKFKSDSQFIVVTHRPGTMEQCDDLYGVTMQKDGVSTILKVKLEDARALAQDNT